MLRYIVSFYAVFLISCTEIHNHDGNTGQNKIDNIDTVVKDTYVPKPNEDDLIRSAIVGKVYLDDKHYDNILYKDIRIRFDENGTLAFEGIIMMYIQEIEDNIEITMNVRGNWKVKDKFLYYKFNDASISSSNQVVQTKIEEGYFSKEEMLNDLNSKNTPEQVIYYGPDKIVTKDVDGENTVMKKSY